MSPANFLPRSSCCSPSASALLAAECGGVENPALHRCELKLSPRQHINNNLAKNNHHHRHCATAIIAVILLPKVTNGAAFLPVLANRRCCQPTPTTTTRKTKTTMPHPPKSPRLPCHCAKAPQLGCEWAEGVVGRRQGDAIIALPGRSCREREVVRGGPGMRCWQKTGGSSNESTQHICRPKNNRPDFLRLPPHAMAKSRPSIPALSSLSSSSSPEAIGSTAAKCGWCSVGVAVPGCEHVDSGHGFILCGTVLL